MIVYVPNVCPLPWAYTYLTPSFCVLLSPHSPLLGNFCPFLYPFHETTPFEYPAASLFSSIIQAFCPHLYLQFWNVLIPLQSQPEQGGEFGDGWGCRDCAASMRVPLYPSELQARQLRVWLPHCPVSLHSLLPLNGSLCLTKVSHSRLNRGN